MLHLTEPDGDSYAKAQWKLVKFHLISTDIGAKMGTEAIGIRIGTCIGLGIGSVKTVLHITIVAICITVRVGIGIGIGIGQWKHAISGARNQDLSPYRAADERSTN